MQKYLFLVIFWGLIFNKTSLYASELNNDKDSKGFIVEDMDNFSLKETEVDSDIDMDQKTNARKTSNKTSQKKGINIESGNNSIVKDSNKKGKIIAISAVGVIFILFTVLIFI